VGRQLRILIRQVLLLCALAAPAGAWTVTLDPVLTSIVGVHASSPSSNDVQDVVAGLPYLDTQAVTSGASSADASHDFDNGGFEIDYDLAAANVGGGGGQTGGDLYFSVDQAVDYVVSGTITAVNPAGFDVRQDIRLQDITDGFTVFRSFNESDITANVSHTVGTVSGDSSSAVFGDFTGTLVADRRFKRSFEVR
jgi:hypothetical protein